MIEIIKRGTKQTHKCSECGCIFNYEDDDINIGVFNVCDTIRCPQCNVGLVLKYYDIKEIKSCHINQM